MPITYRLNSALLDTYYLQLDVSVSPNGKTLKVGAGSFVNESINYVLQEDWEWDLPNNRAYTLTVLGFLVQDKATDAVEMLVDEFWNDGEDELYEFPANGPYKLLVELFEFVIHPEDADDLDAIEIKVRRSKELEQRSEPEAAPLVFPEEG